MTDGWTDVPLAEHSLWGGRGSGGWTSSGAEAGGGAGPGFRRLSAEDYVSEAMPSPLGPLLPLQRPPGWGPCAEGTQNVICSSLRGKKHAMAAALNSVKCHGEPEITAALVITSPSASP